MKQLPLAILLLLSGFYLLTMSGHTYSPDEETMLAVTRGLIERGDVAVVVEPDAPVSALRPGRGDGRYSPYGVLPSLLAIPLHVVGSALAGPDAGARDYASRLAVTALNGPLTAATAALLAAWALRLGASRTQAVGLALLYGLATFAWPYTRTFFSEPLAALLIIAAAYSVWLAEQAPDERERVGLLLGAGLASGMLLPTRIAAGIALPVLGLYLLLRCWQRRPSGSFGQQVLALLRWIWPFLAGIGPGLALLIWYNLARFGQPLASGYASEALLFTTPIAEGLYGLLFSPARSVVLFAPPLLLALPGALALWRRGQGGVVLLALGLFLSHLLLYASWGAWEGGGVWGPRFLLPVIAPLLVLGTGFRLPYTGRRLASIVLLLLGGCGLLGNLGGVLLNFNTYVVATAAPVDDPANAPLIGHWRMLFERWAAYTTPAPVCRLADGFYASEDPADTALPRRSGALGELRCRSEGARLRFSLDDRRPAAAPPSALALTLNGQSLATPPTGQLRTYHLLLAPGKALLGIVAQPWNPLTVGFSERNDELGPQLDGWLGQTTRGTKVALADTAIAPLPTRARPRWAWYYDPPNQHLVDHWAWYMPRSELVGWRMILLAGLLLGLGFAALGAGLRLLLRKG